MNQKLDVWSWDILHLKQMFQQKIENPNNFFFTKKWRKQSYSDLTSPPNKAVMASSELRSRPQMTFWNFT